MYVVRRQLVAAIGLGLGLSLGPCDAVFAASPDPKPASGAAEVVFDLNQLASGGYSADVAKFFARGTRFMPGIHTVGISVNAGSRQNRQATFNSEGQLCFDSSLLAQLRLRMPEGTEPDTCADMAQAYPGMRIELRPGSAQVNLTLPQAAFISDGNADDLQRGGSAALLNYDLFTQHYESRSGSRDYFNMRLEGGINAANWALRTRGSYWHNADGHRYVYQDAYAQRAVEPLNALLQVGQINAMADGFGGTPIIGAQLFSDTAQNQGEVLPVPIQGVAETNAVVEVKQRSQVLYRTVVSPGPYTISNVSNVMRGSDIEVVVTEEDGRTSRFVVPPPMSVSELPQPASFHVGMGRYRNMGGQPWPGAAPWLAYGDYAFNPLASTRLTTSAMLAPRYRGISEQATFAVSENAWLGGSMRASQAPQRGLGHEWQVQGNASLGGGFAGGLSWQMRSKQFSMLEDTIGYSDAEEASWSFQRSISASLSWSNATWGAFSYGVSRSQWQGSTATGHSFSANRRFGRVSANLTLQKFPERGTTAFLNVQVPLGRDSVTTRVTRHPDGRENIGLSYQGRLTPDASYQLEAQRSESSQRYGASMQAGTAYAHMSGGVSQSNAQVRSYYANVGGGLAVTSAGDVALSSSRVSDTFAVVKIPAVSGIRMSGSGSGAKTSVLGTALMPTIYPYRNARIQLDGKTMPLNYRFDTSAIDLKLARGTVATYTINATELRQLMLRVRMPSDDFARVGASVFDARGEFLGTVIGEGNVVLDNEQIGEPIYLDHQGRRCQVRYDVPSRFDPERPYEEADASCA